jgi:CubicO group peptidase (beta-lactamase class C family)
MASFVKRRAFAASKVVPFMFALLAPLAAFAQTAKPEAVGLSSERLRRVNELVDRYIASGDITGAVTLVARSGRVVHLQAQGTMDAASKKPMQKDTMFRIASMSKPVAGVAIMMMIEEGKVRLTDPVSRFIPGFKDIKVQVTKPPRPAGLTAGPPGANLPAETYLVPPDREITVLDLLTHTSGLMSGPVSTAAGASLFQTRHTAGLKWIEGLGAATPLEFAPGSRWSYSAVAGFDVLSRIVEVVSGKTFNEFVNERIFKPLTARDITFWPTTEQRSRLVTSYIKGSDGLQKRDDPDAMSSAVYFSGAGGLMATAESYARFAMMLAEGGQLNGARILAPRTVETMGSTFIPDTLPGRSPGEGYGLSVRVVSDPAARRTMVSKGTFGWSGAYGTHFFVDPEKHLVGILMIQTPVTAMRDDFENAVMQAVID